MYNYIATAAFGLEAVVKREVEKLDGVRGISVSDGRVDFSGGIEVIATANINLRCADRVMLKLAEFDCDNFDKLFDNVYAFNFADIIPKDGKFIVNAKSVKSTLTSLPAIQKVVKKAMVESLKKSYNTNWFVESGAQYSFMLSILKDRAVLCLDSSGAGLHKRGYRIKNYDAPLKETLAAALIDLSFYNKDRLLIDPFCGSGTIAIEAALKAKNIAPGFNRKFECEGWEFLDKSIFTSARESAQSRIDRTQKCDIYGYDINPEAVKLSRENAENAGVGKDIIFSVKAFKDFELPAKSGIIITNPPYAERIGQLSEVRALYKAIGKKLIDERGWSLFLLTSFNDFEKLYGKECDRVRNLFNGLIQTYYYQFHGERPE